MRSEILMTCTRAVAQFGLRAFVFLGNALLVKSVVGPRIELDVNQIVLKIAENVISFLLIKDARPLRRPCVSR